MKNLIIALFAAGIGYGIGRQKDIAEMVKVDFGPGSKPFQIKQVTTDGVVKATIGMWVINPLFFDLTIKSLSVEVYYKNVFLGRVSPIRITLQANSKNEFNLPIEVILSKFNTLIKDVDKSKIDLLFKVISTFEVAGREFTVPYGLTVDVKAELASYAKSYLKEQTTSLLNKLF